MSRLLVVAGEPPWPVVNGGRSRVAGLVGELARRHDVIVLAASWGEAGDAPVRVDLLPASSTGPLHAVLSRAPRIGRRLVDARGRQAIAAAVAATRPDAVLVTHSYLVPLLPPLAVPLVLDLPNLEVDRSRSGARTGGAVHRLLSLGEAVKARGWEPAAVRRAALCLAVTADDAERARSWGAARVQVVPNASDALPLPPSPADGCVLAVADWTYPPNRAGLDDLLHRDWPRVRAAVPTARLLLAGRGAPDDLPAGVTATGWVADLTPLYADAAVVVAPTRSGGGTQLKVADAVAHGRVVVAPPYGRRSLPSYAMDVCSTDGDMASALAHLLTEPADRHAREERLRAGRLSWADAVAPVSAWLEQLVGPVRRG